MTKWRRVWHLSAKFGGLVGTWWPSIEGTCEVPPDREIPSVDVHYVGGMRRTRWDDDRHVRIDVYAKTEREARTLLAEERERWEPQGSWTPPTTPTLLDALDEWRASLAR